jgi:hypothetical protein
MMRRVKGRIEWKVDERCGVGREVSGGGKLGEKVVMRSVKDSWELWGGRWVEGGENTGRVRE